MGQDNFAEDFEGYPTGAFPSSGGWSLRYEGAGAQWQYVGDSYAVSGTRALHLQGSYSWSANAYHGVAVPSTARVSGNVLIEVSSSGWDNQVASLILVEPDPCTWGMIYGGVVFMGDGNIYTIRRSDNCEVIRELLCPYEIGRWHRIVMDFDFVDRTFCVAIDGELFASFVAILATGLPGGVEVTAQHGSPDPVAWFDDVAVASPTTDVKNGQNGDLREVSWQVFPNPTPGSTILKWRGRQSPPKTVTIWSVSGRVVRRIKVGSAESGTFMWDGRDASGRRVASGVYYCAEASASGWENATKLVVLR
jgi:hypothetical protein